jgi:RNA polymerase sigma factor (sigma-70 family)
VLDTDDLAQEILVHAVQRVETFEPRHEGAFQGYLRQMLKNRVLDEVRRAARRPAGAPLNDEHAARDPSPLEIAIGREALERYEAALDKLRPQDQQLIAAAQMAVSRALVRLAEEMANA